MKQNKYDDPEFFGRYSAIPRSVGGLREAQEWHAFRAMLPDLRDKRVLDLGCGFGWHCRYVREQHARSIVGVDLSEKMLERARAATDDPNIEYVLSAIEDVALPAGAFDLALSSLALHYIESLEGVFANVYRSLADGAVFVISVEHPIFTAVATQDWCRDSDGAPQHWPVDDYQQEGARRTQWLAENVVKYHRTVATYINALIAAGFRITQVNEPQPPPELITDYPDMQDEKRRPMFLLLAAVKDGPA